MRTIGGEAELNSEKNHFYLTDSGRSSLRLILSSGLKNKKFLLPDYLCGIILEIFNECGVDYDFYKVNRDLSIDINDVKRKDFEAIYLVNYFGQKHRDWFEGGGIFVIEDCAFSPIVESSPRLKNWIGFNSLRKISYLPEGSIIQSSIRLREELILQKTAGFVKYKYGAKQIKYEYLKDGKHSQRNYLKMFSRGEQALNRQRDIFTISSRGLYNLLRFYKDLNKEYSIRKENYETLDRHLKDFSIRIRTPYPSFYLLDVSRRDGLRKYLFSKKVFLPVHWPRAGNRDNVLYERVISVPLDSRYDKNDLMRVVGLIEKYYSKSRGGCFASDKTN